MPTLAECCCSNVWRVFSACCYCKRCDECRPFDRAASWWFNLVRCARWTVAALGPAQTKLQIPIHRLRIPFVIESLAILHVVCLITQQVPHTKMLCHQFGAFGVQFRPDRTDCNHNIFVFVSCFACTQNGVVCYACLARTMLHCAVVWCQPRSSFTFDARHDLRNHFEYEYEWNYIIDECMHIL